MLETRDAVANIAVKDLGAARRFYEKLGFRVVDEQDGERIVFGSGRSVFNVYRSQYAGSNKATAVTWQVEDASKAVSDLRAKGVTFEHYDMPGMKREGDVHIGGGMKVAWFRDPDGNILNVFSR